MTRHDNFKVLIARRDFIELLVMIKIKIDADNINVRPKI